MIKLENVKICPLYNHNFTITNEDELVNLLPSVPIVINFDYHGEISYESIKIIGMVAPNGNMSIEDDFITSDVFIEEEYKDYVFNNYCCNLCEYNKEYNTGKILRFDVIGFDK